MSKKLQHGPHDMFDVLDAATNSDQFAAGHVDALAHVGMMLTGGVSPETMSDIQDSTVYDEDTEPEYVTGYFHTWNVVYNLMFDAVGVEDSSATQEDIATEISKTFPDADGLDLQDAAMRLVDKGYRK